MNSVKLLFWDWRRGRTGRGGFVLSSLLIWGVMGGAALLVPSPLEGDTAALGGRGMLAALLAVAVLALLALIGSLNLAAKRVRDIGAPGWGVVIGMTLMNGVLIFAVPALAYPWFSIAVFAALALAPSNALSLRGWDP